MDDPFSSGRSGKDSAKSPLTAPSNIFDDVDKDGSSTNLKVGLAVAFVVRLGLAFIVGHSYLRGFVERMQERSSGEGVVESNVEAIAKELDKPTEERDFATLYAAYREAARAGHEPSMQEIGLHFTDGRYLYEDAQSSLAWFENAARAGSRWAQFVLGYRRLTGEVFTRDLDQAEAWLTKAATVDPGEVTLGQEDDGGPTRSEAGEAALYLASLYFHPKYERVDEQRAFQWFYEAAQQGVVEGQFMTSEGFRLGWGGKISGGKAKYWQAAALKEDDSEALVRIAYLFYSDVLVPKDVAKAAKFYQEAAKSSDPSALYDLANLYETGTGVDKDPGKAMQLYETAAELGHKEAAFALGYSHRYGVDGKRDLQTAVHWLERAEQLGSVEALSTLAQLYETGTGVAKDEERALELYESACSAGEWIGCAYEATLRKKRGEEKGDELFDSVIDYYTRQCEIMKNQIECYNRACLFALSGMTDEALASLEQAVALGYDDYDHMRRDDDLKSLRDDPRFEKLLQGSTK